MGKEQNKKDARTEPLTDEALLSRVVQRDEEAFRELMDRHGAKVRGILAQMLRDRDEVREVESLTWMSVWRAAHTFNGGSQVSTWLYRVAWNDGAYRLRMMSRRRKREKTIPFELKQHEVGASFEPDYGARSKLFDILYMARKLPAEDRAVFDCLTREFVAREGAAMLGITEACYKSRLYRMRKIFNRRRAISV